MKKNYINFEDTLNVTSHVCDWIKNTSKNPVLGSQLTTSKNKSLLIQRGYSYEDSNASDWIRINLKIQIKTQQLCKINPFSP